MPQPRFEKISNCDNYTVITSAECTVESAPTALIGKRISQYYGNTMLHTTVLCLLLLILCYTKQYLLLLLTQFNYTI